jgi:hypothetical protein
MRSFFQCFMCGQRSASCVLAPESDLKFHHLIRIRSCLFQFYHDGPIVGVASEGRVGKDVLVSVKSSCLILNPGRSCTLINDRLLFPKQTLKSFFIPEGVELSTMDRRYVSPQPQQRDPNSIPLNFPIASRR